MAANAAVAERLPVGRSGRAGGVLAKGVATGYLSLVVLLPLAALVCLGAGVGCLVLERSLPAPLRLTPG